ncbi:MAG: WD40/YVTN/BNR-like repeat-containing protein [Candidatus Tyrphobacter sp.]
MSWRQIGPAAGGGRIAAVAGTDQNANLYYVGTAGGGVWKSANGGATWDPVFDSEPVAAIGAVAIDPNDEHVVWVGTGESNPRNDVSYGDGVYKTTDGGKTWTNVGLAGTKYISRILVDPRDSNHVIVGALGDVFSDSTERGVYVTWDGGKTWHQTLYVGPQSGASDLALDEQNPAVVYAGIWRFQRRPWTFTSGGDRDGLYKSTDGGRTWTRLTGHGLPSGVTGRIGLAVAPSDGNRVYALIESSEGILWRSDDGGANWTMVSNDTLVDQRPFYFTHIAVDPKNADRVYAVSEMLSLSTDGGHKFRPIAEAVHVDYHAIWISASDPHRIIVGEDGGYAITVDGGRNWASSLNMPIAQIYRVGLSNENPYTVCVGLQDNNAWCGPSNSLDPSGILNKYWIVSAGGDGEWALVDPSDPNWIWSDSEDGALQLYNRVTQDGWSADPYIELGSESFDQARSRYRFNWESPIAFAPWDPHVAWYGGDVVFQTTDRGKSWTIVSPDLTRNDKAHQQPSGGPITHDVSGAEYSDTILDIEGSTLRRGEIWVGTDDGYVQMTLDGGKHWHNVTPPGAATYGRFATVAPSRLRDGTVYAIEDDHYMGDNAPYAWVTHDFGRHWTSIVAGIPRTEWARSIRPDVKNPSIVYLGTELGIYISFNEGRTWHSFLNGISHVSVHDIRMQPRFDDLVIATHGRSVYIMDDMRPIQELQSAIAHGTALFTPRTAYEYTLHENDEGAYTRYAADNPPYGVMITFYQSRPQKGAPSLEILDSHGRVIRTVSGTHKVFGHEIPYIDNKAGLNRYVWDFNIDGPVKYYGAAKLFQGPDDIIGVPPGEYAVRMTLSGHTYVRHFRVGPDPRSHFTQAEYEQTYALGRHLQALFSNVDIMLNDLDAAKATLATDLTAANAAHNAALAAQIETAQRAHDALFNELTANYQNSEDGIERPGKLREDIETAFFSALGLETQPALAFVRRVEIEYHGGLDHYNAYVRSLAPLDASLHAAKLTPIPAKVTEIR